jgi:hypothetical protein
MDYSTINLEELRKLPLYRLRPGHHLSDNLGSGCHGDAPGYPSYFIQSVFTSRGDTPRSGPDGVIADPERDGEYRVIDDLRDERGYLDFSSIYIPVSMKSSRFDSWEHERYRHLMSCYHDPEEKNDMLIWPIPYYRLNNIAVNKSLSSEQRKEQKVLWGPSIEGDTIIWNFRFRERYYTDVEDQWIQFIESKRSVAVPENHEAVRAIRKIYPEYRPNLEMIVHSPTMVKPDWWERSSHPLV